MSSIPNCYWVLTIRMVYFWWVHELTRLEVGHCTLHSVSNVILITVWTYSLVWVCVVDDFVCIHEKYFLPLLVVCHLSFVFVAPNCPF